MNQNLREQQLVDLMFDISLTIFDGVRGTGTNRAGESTKEFFDNLSREDLCEWVAVVLRTSGFPTAPKGVSWGVLV